MDRDVEIEPFPPPPSHFWSVFYHSDKIKLGKRVTLSGKTCVQLPQLLREGAACGWTIGDALLELTLQRQHSAGRKKLKYPPW